MIALKGFAAVTAVRRLWRVRRYSKVVPPAARVPGVAAGFLRYMYGAVRGGKFTDAKEQEGRRRWVAVYDAGVRVLRALPGLRR